MLFLLWPLRFLCLRKDTILWSEQALFLMLLWKNLLVLKREVAAKLSFQRLGSAGILVLYRMMAGGESFIDALYSKDSM